MVHSEVTLNYVSQAMIKCIAKLLEFGFQSDYNKIKDLCQVLVKILDGRSDRKTKKEAFKPKEERFAGTTESFPVTSAKGAVIDVLVGVANLRANFRLAKVGCLTTAVDLSDSWPINPLFTALIDL